MTEQKIEQPSNEAFTDAIVEGLKKIETQTGIRFSKIEEDYLKYFANLANQPLAKRRQYALMQVKSMTANMADNPLVDYEVLVIGSSELPKSANVICYTMMKRKDAQGTPNGDPLDFFNPAEGKLGIPTIAAFFEGSPIRMVDKLTPFSFWNANLTTTGTGVPRREVSATSYTNFVPINKPEVTTEQIEAFKNKIAPLMSLAQVKTNPSKKLAARKEGAKQYADSLDLRRCEVTIKRPSKTARKEGGGFVCSYTVIDNSLTEAEMLNVRDATGKVTKYGGVQIYLSASLYDSLNLAEESIIEVIGTATVDSETGTLALNAFTIIPIVKNEKKAPASQRAPVSQTGAVQGRSLADMAGAPTNTPPATYV
ncbi:MAG: hypothetical protein WC623_22150 [Pedobacter sp.]|uniref:hypothetical protein n=1 Tax=Pedobacter sp. TaxID=1411316 RepID=UPI003569FF53